MKYQTIFNIEINDCRIPQKHECDENEIIIFHKGFFICRINAKKDPYRADSLKTVSDILALHFQEEDKRERELRLIPGEYGSNAIS